MKKSIKHTAIIIAALWGAAMIFSCSNDIEQVRALDADALEPPQEIENFRMVYTDSGVVKMRMFAGKVLIETIPGTNPKKFNRRASDGVEFISFNKSTKRQESKLTSNRAIEYGDKNMSEAIGNVVVINDKGDSLLTERLIWDKTKNIYYSDEYTKIIQGGDIIRGRKGFRSNEDFTQYTVFQSEGMVSIKDSLSGN